MHSQKMSIMSGNVRRCIVPQCENTSFNSPELKFYAFPKDSKLKLKWMENLKIKKFINKRNLLCGVHFEDKLQCGQRLKKNSVPTLYLGHSGPVTHKYKEHETFKRKCCVESCKRKMLYKNHILFRFTDNKSEKNAWAKACNLPLPLPSKQLYICSRHFEEEYISKVRLFDGAFPKFFLTGEDDDDVEQSDEKSNASDQEPRQQEQIQELNVEIEKLRESILLLENNAIYPQPGSSAEALIFARMIVGDKKADFTDKEKALAKKLRCNMSAIAYRFMTHYLGCRLPLFKASDIIKFKLEGKYRK